MTQEAGVEFDILGPLMVQVVGGANLAPASTAPRQLLAVLALHIGRPVPQSYLCEALSQSGAALAPSTVRAIIAKLRKRPEFAATIRTSSHGYLVPDELCVTDLDSFRNSLNDGRKYLDGDDLERAESCLLHALSLWREPHLACLPRTPPTEPMLLQLA